MDWRSVIAPKTYKPYTIKDLMVLQQRYDIPRDIIEAIRIVASVLPFRTNNYVADELIDWENIPNDPIFQLTFPQKGMLAWQDYERIKTLINTNAAPEKFRQTVKRIQYNMNPHPAGQIKLNMPVEAHRVYKGMQHKYKETVLFFPSQGQTCHAFCTYCFRWAQFAGLDHIKFATSDVDALMGYLRRHPEITDILITGGDPLVMRTRVLRTYLEPLIADRPGNLTSIRIGTKVPAYWPYRFVTDKDADDLMRLFGQIVDSGFNLSIMAHFSHPRELMPAIAETAVKRILSTGAGVRCQAPLIRHLNDDADLWAEMWKREVALGAVPYYMFIQRDTGPKAYFKLPLTRAYNIFSDAYRQVSGLCRTVRGPSMSATPGKILLDGICDVAGERVFALKFLQGRDPAWVNRLFFAKYSPSACWLDDLKPAFGETQFFFESDLKSIESERADFDDASSF